MKDTKNAIDHLKDHQKYPATKEELVKECNSLSDFSKKDKEWFEQHLEDRNYTSANDVIKTLGLNMQATSSM